MSSMNIELFEEYYKYAEEIMSKMTLEQKIGQIFFPKYKEETKDNDISKYFIGGFVLYGNDFKNEEDIAFCPNLFSKFVDKIKGFMKK